jgi:hypothetical protein
MHLGGLWAERKTMRGGGTHMHSDAAHGCAVALRIDGQPRQQWRNVLMPENEHVKQLSAARGRLIADRRSAATAIADESRRGLNGDSCDALILIQTTIETIDRAIEDEKQLARDSDASAKINVVER